MPVATHPGTVVGARSAGCQLAPRCRRRNDELLPACVRRRRRLRHVIFIPIFSIAVNAGRRRRLLVVTVTDHVGVLDYTGGGVAVTRAAYR